MSARFDFTVEEFKAAAKKCREHLYESIFDGLDKDEIERIDEAIKQGEDPIKILMKKHGITLSKEEIDGVVKTLLEQKEKITDDHTFDNQ